MTGHLTPTHWVVLVLVTLGVTWAGHRLAGVARDRSTFFHGDGTLPWWAVSASIIATVISAVTFISVPAFVFKPGGDMGYVQVLLGLMLGKVLTAWLFARPYYEFTTASTTYDYVGQRIDARAGRFSLTLGLGLTVINAGVKMLTSGLVLAVITGWSLLSCTGVVTVVAVIWSGMAGLKTVVWTDFLLFVLFTLGAIAAIIWTLGALPHSLASGLEVLDSQAKLALFDFSVDPTVSYTIWAGVIGGAMLSLALASTQGTLQRVRACRSVADARRAYLYASFFYLTPVCMIGVGAAMTLYYDVHPLAATVVESLSESPDRIFPYFVVTEVPIGLSALLVAAIFAASISTLDTSLTEITDVTVTHGYARWVRGASEKHYLRVSRGVLAAWGVVFAAVAMFFSRFQAEGLLDLTFKLPNYLNGALLGTLIIARFGLAGWRPYVAGFLVAALVVYTLQALGVAFFWWCPVSGLAMVLVAWTLGGLRGETSGLTVLAPVRGERDRRTHAPSSSGA